MFPSTATLEDGLADVGCVKTGGGDEREGQGLFCHRLKDLQTGCSVIEASGIVTVQMTEGSAPQLKID